MWYDDFPPDLRRKVRRRIFIGKATGKLIIWTFAAFSTFSVGYLAFIIVMDIYDDDAWPSAIFFALLAMYCWWTFRKYVAQKQAEKDGEEDYFYPTSLLSAGSNASFRCFPFLP